MKERVLLLLATKKGLAVLLKALEYADSYEFFVSTFEEKHMAVSFHEEIVRVAQEAGIQVLPLPAVRQNLYDTILDLGISKILCAGWRYLIGDRVLELLNGRVIVAHDSLLPKLRGFAPLVTAMLIGDTETGVTFLKAGSGVDDGPILWQDRVTIGPTDTIGDLIEKLLPLYQRGTELFLTGKLSNETPQDSASATYSIWRDERDYFIDWNWDASYIERFIRALGNPYAGARTRLGGKVVVIQRATVVEDLRFAVRQPGKVWAIDQQGRPVVVCGSGMLRIESGTLDGYPLLPLSRLRLRFE